MDFHLFEKDLANVAPGCEVVIRTAAFPGREFRSRLAQIGNVVNEQARTLEARAELENPQGDLRPGMFIEAEITPKAQARLLLVPAAPSRIFKAARSSSSGREPIRSRSATWKPASLANGFMEIRKGLKDQETVATHGSFFIKSELLKNSLGGE